MIYKVRIPQLDKDVWRDVDAFCPEDAAEEYAEHAYNGDPVNPDDIDFLVEVIDEHGYIRKFKVGGYSEIIFTVDEIN